VISDAEYDTLEAELRWAENEVIPNESNQQNEAQTAYMELGRPDSSAILELTPSNLTLHLP